MAAPQWPALPLDAPGIVIVQYMPENFTTAFARGLDSICRLFASIPDADLREAGF